MKGDNSNPLKIKNRDWSYLKNVFITSSFIKEGLNFRNPPRPHPKKRRVQILLTKGRSGKIGWLFSKKWVTSLILIITSTFESYLSLSESLCLFCVFTPYLSEFFVSYEEINLTESNQLIRDFYKSMIFQQSRHCRTL